MRTALDWLANFDSHRDEIETILRGDDGNEPLWMRRWRWFFLATAGLFGCGREWDVSHYWMKAAG